MEKGHGVLIDRINQFHHSLLDHFVNPGDQVADCTAGNGHDALFLARQVGRRGHLFCFDVQVDAIKATRKRLELNGIEEERFTLICDSHARLEEFLSPGLSAVVYNLGYLPGSDRTVVTDRESTVASVDGALSLIKPGGVVSITLYYGHPGAEEEASGLLEYASGLDPAQAKVLHLTYPNLPNRPPTVLIVQRAP